MVIKSQSGLIIANAIKRGLSENIRINIDTIPNKYRNKLVFAYKIINAKLILMKIMPMISVDIYGEQPVYMSLKQSAEQNPSNKKLDLMIFLTVAYRKNNESE